MRYCNIQTPDGIIGCAAAEKGLVPFEKLGFSGTLQELIEADTDTQNAVRTAAENWTGETLNPETAAFANVTAGGKLLCVGLNYKKHAEETKGEAPPCPVYFSKFGDALCPDKTEVELPPWQRCYDYEGELVIVIGRTAWHIEEDEADDYIFGYSVGDDLSARDCQFLSNQWLSGKSMPNFAPTGPYVTTKDSFDPEKDNRIVTRVNGTIRQDDFTSGMIFTCRHIVANASKYFKLQPGDLIYTGTSAGVILGMPKGTRVWLKPGDTVEVEIEGIGTLTNRMI